MFYNDTNSSVSLSHGSKRFLIKQAIRQRGQIIVYYSVELMALYLKISSDIHGITVLGKEFFVSQFADDTALFSGQNYFI